MHSDDPDTDPGADDAKATARAILGANVRRLIDDAQETRPQIASILKVAQQSMKLTHGSSSLSKSRVGRIVKGSHATDIDALNDLAEVFGVQPWQLLVENLNPKALPRLVDAEFLSQIKQIVNVAQAPNQAISPSATDEHPIQKQERTQQVQVGPALQKAFTGKKNLAGRGSSEAQKQGGGRRR